MTNVKIDMSDVTNIVKYKHLEKLGRVIKVVFLFGLVFVKILPHFCKPDIISK